MSKNMDKTAKTVVTFTGKKMFEAHRGAIWWTENIIAIFGNDGFRQTDWVKKEVAALRQLLVAQEITERGFAVGDDGYSWALLIDAPTPLCQTPAGDLFRREVWSSHHNDLVWEAWRKALAECGRSPGTKLVEIVQRAIAAEVIE